MCVCLVGLSVGYSVFMLGCAQFHGCLSPALSLQYTISERSKLFVTVVHYAMRYPTVHCILKVRVVN